MRPHRQHSDSSSSWAPLKKLPLEHNFPVCLAPMVGLSHVAFRRVLRSYLPAGVKTIWPTEMLNSRRIPSERFDLVPETFREPNADDLVPQILGNEERFISESVKRLEGEWGAAGIDINMGCSVLKALKHNYGVSLMGDADYAARVVEMTVRHTKLPVSVKLRAGQDVEDLDYLMRFARGLRDAGASWLTLHPRLGSQGRRGRANWKTIGLVQKEIHLPVVGNGDVQTVEDVWEMLSQTGCSQVMVGRALTARPWLLWQVGERLGFAPPAGRTGPAPRSPEEEATEYGRFLLSLSAEMAKWFAEGLGVRRFKFIVRFGSTWLDFGNTLAGELSRAETFGDIDRILNQFFIHPGRMLSYTEWRN